MPMPFPIRRPHRHRPQDEPFSDADVVLAQLEDAVRKYDGVMDRLMQVLRPPHREGC